MNKLPLSLPDYLPESARALTEELYRQKDRLMNAGLAELLGRIAALRVASKGYTVQNGAVTSAELAIGAEPIARALIPWRKGPFRLGSLFIDAEWRSDLKWNRLKSHLPVMAGKTVADVGCNNGYYLYRIAETGAKHILGLDPTLKYYLQYCLIAAHTGQIADFLPLGWQALWQMPQSFDTIFLMGVNYHDPEPLEIFHACHHALREGGVLICESVVVESQSDIEIFPEGKYAGIRGVYAIPSPRALERQLKFVGFQNVTLLYTERLLPTEQRRSEFSPQASLAEHLREEERTGKHRYPLPFRAALLCRL